MTGRSILVGAVALAALVLAVRWVLQDPAVAANAPGSPLSKTGAAVPARLPASSVLAIDMTKSSPPVASRGAPIPVTLAREYEQSTSLKPLYDRLLASHETAEAKYVLYRILSGCARKTDPLPEGRPAPKSWEERRKSLEASISDSNPQKALRLKTFDEMRRCQGIEEVATSRAELDKLLDAAALEGDPRARALQVQREMGGDQPRGSSPITDAQLRTLQESVASRDPAAIVIAGTVLSNTYSDMVIEVGNAHEPLDNAAARRAWMLLACEYGLDCGPGNSELRQSCAYAGRCGAGSLPDYVFFFDTTPNQAQLVDQYRQIFRQSIDSNDWSGVTFARRQTAPNSVFRFFTPGP